MDGTKIITVFLALSSTSVSATICGVKPYNEETDICCDGNISTKFVNGFEQICCDKKLYSKQSNSKQSGKCCTEKFRKYSNLIKEPVCCGQDLMLDQEMTVCCNDKQFSRSDYSCNKTWKIEIPHKINQIACFKYNKPEDYDIHYDPNNSLDCCGKQTITKGNKTHECNDEEVVLKDDLGTCGNQKYSFKEKICCHESMKLIRIPPEYKFEDGGYPNVACVNGKFVDLYQMQVVKAGGTSAAIPKGKTPCGNTYYDKTVKDRIVNCCDGVLIYNRAGSDVECCGNTTYDKKRNTCCQNTLYPLTESCCGGKVYRLSEKDETCCQGKLINTTQQLCCKAYGQNRIIPKGNAMDDLCCGMRTYDSGRKSCCGTTIVDHWNETTHKCENGQVVKPSPIDTTISRINVTPKPDGFKEMKSVCPMDSQTGGTCTKRYEFRFFVVSQSGREMNVVLLSPKSLEGLRLTLLNRNMRKCIMEQNSYSLYTNRDYRRRLLDQNFRLSFTNRDVISKLSMVGTRMRPAVECKIDRYHKEKRS